VSRWPALTGPFPTDREAQTISRGGLRPVTACGTAVVRGNPACGVIRGWRSPGGPVKRPQHSCGKDAPAGDPGGMTLRGMLTSPAGSKRSNRPAETGGLAGPAPLRPATL